MIRIQFPHPATLVSAFQHPCRTFFAAALVVAGPLFLINQAEAALNCTAQPSCSELGYSQLLDKNCISYLKCPFDQSYQICIKSRPEVLCPDGYSKDKRTVADCGSKGSDGWTFESTYIRNDSELEICGKCTAKTCPEGSSTITFCKQGSTIEKVGYSGDNECTKCVSTVCLEGYATSVSNCGTTGANGWMFTEAVLEPNAPVILSCKKCVPKPCPLGYEAGIFCRAGQTIQSSGYSGDMRCNKCIGSVTPPPVTITCADLSCKYDCSNLGGPKCSNSPTYGSDKNAYCMMCAQQVELK